MGPLSISIIAGVLLGVVWELISLPFRKAKKTKERRKRSQLLKKERMALNELIGKHELALRNNWHQTVFEDEYGRVDMEKWGSEVAKFIVSTGFHYKAMTDYAVLDLVTGKISKTVEPVNVPIESQNPYEFEVYCADILSQYGWEAQVTKKSGDQGADIIAIKNGISVAIQCKLYSKPVGNKAVQEVNSGKLYYSADHAVVVATKGYTASAKKLAQKTGVLLLTPLDIKNLEKYL